MSNYLLLQQVGKFFHGDEWQAPLARDLSVNERTMRRWVAGTEEVPRGVWRDLAARIEMYGRMAQGLLAEVKRASGLVEVTTNAMQAPGSSSIKAPPVPPGWGTDELTAFIDAARNNQHGTFFRKRPAMQKLVAIDAQFAKVTKNWMNPASEILALLFVRCHGAFRTAAGLAMAGQGPETYVQCRAMLEYGGYGVHIHRDPPLGMVWLDRHQSPKQMTAQKTAFSHAKVAASVTAANRDAGKRFEDLYQQTIDFGGHPNERSITGNLKMVEEPDRRVMLAVLLHQDGPELDMALKTVARCGMVALEMWQVIDNAKFELLGINADMLDLRKGL